MSEPRHPTELLAEATQLVVAIQQAETTAETTAAVATLNQAIMSDAVDPRILATALLIGFGHELAARKRLQASAVALQTDLMRRAGEPRTPGEFSGGYNRALSDILAMFAPPADPGAGT